MGPFYGLSTESLAVILNSGMTKRALDILGAVILLIIFSPIILLSALFIRLSGSRSVIFRQTRIGLNGKPFQLFKLTTMKPQSHLNGPMISTRRDSRVTLLGRFLRAFGFNELPQLVNVLRGEMSLVGPRPEVPRYLEHWSSEIND